MVAEIGENIENSIHHDNLSHFGSEAILPEDTVKKGILGVLITFSITYYFNNLNLCLIFFIITPSI